MMQHIYIYSEFDIMRNGAKFQQEKLKKNTSLLSKNTIDMERGQGRLSIEDEPS